MTATAFLVPFGLAGLAAVVAVLVERSRIAFGSLALYGNGALIVPVFAAALILFGAWTWLLRRGAGARQLVAAAGGTYLGIGLSSPLAAILNGSLDTRALSGFLLQGLVFVLPTALLGGAAAWAFLSGGLPLRPVAVAIMLIAGLPFGSLFPPFATGLATGTAVALGVRAREASRIAAIAAGLGVFVLVVGFGVPLLLIRG